MSGPQIYKGKGAFFFPPIIVKDSKEELSVTDKYQREIVLYYEFSDCRILISDDGFLGVITKDENSTLRIINVIFATSLQFGIQAQKVKGRELCGFEWQDGNKAIKISSSYNILEIRNRAAYERDEAYSLWKQIDRKRIAPNDMKKIIERAEQYDINPILEKRVLLLSEAWSFSFDESFTPSFLFSWTIIEMSIDLIWKKHVDSLRLKKEEREPLEDERSWHAYNRIDIFFLIGKMDLLARNKLQELRKIRNKIVHDGYEQNIKEAKECIDTAALLLYNEIRSPDNPFNSV